MKPTSDGAEAKATNKAEAGPTLSEMLETVVSVPPLRPADCAQGNPNCAKCAIAASLKRKVMTLVFTLCLLGFLFMAPFGPAIGALAQNVDGPEAAAITHVVARAVEVNSTTSVADSACTKPSGSTYPAPSAVSVTATVDAATATATSGMSVTPMSSETSASGSSCAAPVTVTVTVTTQATADAVSGTAGASGAPPQSSESTASTSTTTMFSTTTATSTLTSTASLTQTSTTTSTASDTTGTLSMTTSTNSTGTTTTTTVTTSSLSLIHTLGTATGTGVGTIIYGTGTGGAVGTIGTASFTIHPSANGSFTYSMPSVSPSHPLTTVISSSASAVRVGPRGHGGGRDQRGGNSGFYCVVMAFVACGFALVV